MSGPKKKVKTSWFGEAGAEELVQRPVEVKLVEVKEPTPVAVEPDLDAGTEDKPEEQIMATPDTGTPSNGPDMGVGSAALPVFEGETTVRVEPETAASELRLVNQELQVYQGSLTLWIVGACLLVNMATQFVKFATKYPLHQKKPPFRIPDRIWLIGGMQVGGWSSAGYGWFIKLFPFLFALPVAPYVVPASMDALGFPGKFSTMQTLWFSPFIGGGAIGVWSLLPDSVKSFLNREHTDEPSGLATNSDVERLNNNVEKVMAAIDELSIDAELKDVLRSATEEHSSVVETFDAETLND